MRSEGDRGAPNRKLATRRAEKSCLQMGFSWRNLHQMNPTTLPIGALKIRDAAKYLGGVSEITVRRLIKRGLITPNRALRHVLIPVSELDRFLAGPVR